MPSIIIKSTILTAVKRVLCFKHKNDSVLQFYRKVPCKVFLNVSSLQHVKNKPHPTALTQKLPKAVGFTKFKAAYQSLKHYNILPTTQKCSKLKTGKKSDLLNHCFQISLICLVELRQHRQVCMISHSSHG